MVTVLSSTSEVNAKDPCSNSPTYNVELQNNNNNSNEKKEEEDIGSSNHFKQQQYCNHFGSSHYFKQ